MFDRVDLGLTDAQAVAIGHLSVAFNWLESAVEFLIEEIMFPASRGSVAVFMENMSFASKVTRAIKLVKMLPDQAKASSEHHSVLAVFLRRADSRLRRAHEHNAFRNKLIHWRPFERTPTVRKGDTEFPKAPMTVQHDVETIKKETSRTEETALHLLELALLLRDRDYSINWAALQRLAMARGWSTE